MALTGCAGVVDLLIWGPDGARVIDTTELLVATSLEGEDTPLACTDSDADFGDPADWQGLSAGEPERISEFWKEQAALGATWSINLEGTAPDVEPGDTQPGDVFYREDGGELCVIDIVWVTIESISR